MFPHVEEFGQAIDLNVAVTLFFTLIDPQMISLTMITLQR